MRDTLPSKDPDRRNTRLQRHLETDYSKCVGVVRIGARAVKPVVVEDELLVETEFGCLTLSEVYGDSGELPTEVEYAERLAEVQKARGNPEIRRPKQFNVQVYSTKMMGKGRRSED